MITLSIALAVVSLIFMVQATTQEELKLEKAQLEQELIDSGFGWLEANKILEVENEQRRI